MAIIDKLKNKLSGINSQKDKIDKKNEKPVEKLSKSSKPAKQTNIGKLADVLIKPIVTEKSANLSGQNKYIFLVNRRANKNQIAAAIKAAYQIKPTQINIVNKKGKKKKFGKIKGQRKNIKKAIITLPKGKKLEVYEGV